MKVASARQFESPSRVNDHFSGGLFAGNLFDSLNGQRHREHATHFALPDMQRHSYPLCPGPGSVWGERSFHSDANCLTVVILTAQIPEKH